MFVGKADEIADVVDYRRVNEYLKPLSYRMPTCDSLWYTLGRAKYISTADCADGYWLAPLDPSTSWMTAVDTPQGRMEWTCLPMGIQPAAGWYTDVPARRTDQNQ